MFCENVLLILDIAIDLVKNVKETELTVVKPLYIDVQDQNSKRTHTSSGILLGVRKPACLLLGRLISQKAGCLES